MPNVTISRGVAPGEEPAAAALFWQAFAGKLGRVLGPEPRALRYLTGAIQPRNAICARDASGRLVGLAGIKTRAGGLIAGDMTSMAAVYGWVGALWRGPLLEMTDRPLAIGQMSLDGLCVAPEMRGAGVGHALIDAVIAECQEQGLREVWLEVVDTNPRARALYLREGFVSAGETRLGVLRYIFGFEQVEAMVRVL